MYVIIIIELTLCTYNWHTINNYSILLIITNNKNIKYNNYKSGKREPSSFKALWVFLIHIRIESFICFQSIFIILAVLLAQTWNKKQFYFDSEVCSNESRSLWFTVPWGTITMAVTLVLSSPREWTNNYAINFFPRRCFVVLYWINVERSHLTYPLKSD